LSNDVNPASPKHDLSRVRPVDPFAPLRRVWRRWLTPRVLDRGFLARAVANPLTRPFANAQARQLHDLVAGFVYSQTLAAAVSSGLLEVLREGPAGAAALAPRLGLAPERAKRLAQAAAGLGLVAREGDIYHLAPLGAAALTAPGVVEMVRHHRLLYEDLADPVGLLEGGRETRLARYWAYVGGARTHDLDPETAAEYSALMAATQAMVADETLAAVPLGGVRRLLDVGGGEGAFLEAAALRHPRLGVALFDLPAVADRAEARFRAAGLSDRATLHPGSFLDDPLPEGCDAVSLVRVLYDHDDAVAARILARVHAALPPGGLLIVSEPMSGGDRPSRVGDAYFGFYTLAMTTGRPRSPAEHARLLEAAGFARVRHHATRQGLITSVVTARRA
jgi:demethylspheroidene O-methyltransferase